jgi:ubiquinone/menaquinone biosynthesis C-methylase UbiE
VAADRAWHDAGVTDQGSRYDRMATGYARYWAPVLAPSVAELLDMATPAVTNGQRIIDVGTGTGQLAIAALGRWPAASIVGIDASSGMLDVAGAEAERLLPSDVARRFERLAAFADRLPFDDGSFDVALSSFVFQQVPNRARALREVRRVLRPGGTLAYVSWLEGGRSFVPDEIFDDVLDEVGIGAREVDGRSGDIPTVERAANELRRAGFEAVTARAGRIGHRFTVDTYIEFLSDFDEETLFDEFDPDERERVIRRLRGRLTRLSAETMTMRFPTVFATGRRTR